MDVSKMFEMQKQLDERIRKEHGLVNEDLIKEKIVAFQVELGELANETRCFKYWSVKPASDKSIILEEYVDGIHFLLSLGLDIDCLELNLVQNSLVSGNLVDQFQHVFTSCGKFSETKSKTDFQQLFTHYYQLGSFLGFTDKEIEEAYIGKNKVNHQRQNEGY